MDPKDSPRMPRAWRLSHVHDRVANLAQVASIPVDAEGNDIPASTSICGHCQTRSLTQERDSAGEVGPTVLRVEDHVDLRTASGHTLKSDRIAAVHEEGMPIVDEDARVDCSRQQV